MTTESEFLAALRALPLHPGARGLLDDTAHLDGLILTTDTVVEGVHYLADDPPADVAWKLLAANLSDLAAKGATPEGVLLNYPLCPSPAKAGAQLWGDNGEGLSSVTSTFETGPRPSGSPESNTFWGAPSPGKEEDWDGAFLGGLHEALTRFTCPLLGGDTVSLPAGAPRVITLTAIGRATDAPTRTGARAGDALYVTGTIGDAGAGLRIARGAPGPAALRAAYRRPQPRLAEGRALASHVHAMMDVSDGLLLDAARMAAASGLAVTIDLAAVPLSADYRAFAGDDRPARLAAATAGDDYQLLFAAPADAALPVPATRVGTFAERPGAPAKAGARNMEDNARNPGLLRSQEHRLSLTDDGEPVPLPPTLGFTHDA